MTDTTIAEAEIAEVLAGMYEAWNAGDAAAYAAHFTEDVNYIPFFGVAVPGRAALEEGHRALFAGPMKNSKLVAGDVPPKFTFVRPDVAIVVAGGGSALDGADKPQPGRESTLTYVFVREPAGWLAASFQNTRVQDPTAGRPR
ncbi:YybH family protein [Amycolatopsis nigrescens]|uniref:YybH family protein n=1 Tax=Amycolatopsis nigrescens TaxID=381445 RepID=UPI000366AD2E|nr:SgcJ/EcaC family oxidoreductase [Amycolatopsis nigrescens]